MKSAHQSSPRHQSLSRNKWLSLLTVLLLACSTWGHKAQAALINISLSNTGQLPANTGFLLQYNNLNGVADNNRVNASNFSGLTPTGTPDYLGTASGNLNGSPSNPQVGDSANGFTNEFFQSFTPSGNTISFNVDTAINGVSGTAPFDSLRFQLFRQDGNPFTTNAPDGESLFTLTFDSLSNPTINSGLGNFSTNDPSLTGAQITATVTTAAVPEPSTWAMMALGIGALGLVARRKRSAAQNSNEFVSVAI